MDFTMAEQVNDEVWTAGDLLERLEHRDKFFVLDVRNRDEFERFRLEGRSPVPAVNIPYFEMLELGGRDEMLDSVVAYVEQELADQLPSDLPILAVCAKGDTRSSSRSCAAWATPAPPSRGGGKPGVSTMRPAPWSKIPIWRSTR
jgi:rhodanese-related sulfurtransferase